MTDVERSRWGSKQSPSVWCLLKNLLTYWGSQVQDICCLSRNHGNHSIWTVILALANAVAACNVLLFQKLMTVTIHTQPIWWSLGLLHLAVHHYLHILSICGTVTLKTLNLDRTWQYIMGGMTSVQLDLKIDVFYSTAWANNAINYGYKHLQIAGIARVYYQEVKNHIYLTF